MLKPKSLTVPKKDLIDTVEVGAALEFLRRYYPSFWSRVDEEDIVRLLLIGHTVFKVHPELIEATNETRKVPTQ